VSEIAMLTQLEECKDQLLRLAEGSTATNQLAKRAGQLTAGYWGMMDSQQWQQLELWLDALHVDSQRLVTPGSAMKEKLRQAEVAMGAMEAIEGLALPG
jgi:hypothetical protein